MPDGAIVIPDTAAAPKDYTLSGAQEIALKSVRALIDGTGAGSAFLPTLQLLDPNGHVMWEGAAQSTVAAGGSADVSWFPVGAQLGGATSSGAVISAYAFGGGFPIFGPGVHNLTFGSLIKNDSMFSASAAPPFSFINLTHGGQIRVDATLAWSSNTGAPYVGEFILQTAILDSALSPTQQMVGPPATITQVYSTAVGDAFVTEGTSVFNAGLVSDAGPPYHARLTFQNDQSVGLNGYSMFVALENPTPLT